MMDAFIFWFIRPFAEFVGAVVFLALVILVLAAVAGIMELIRSRTRERR